MEIKRIGVLTSGGDAPGMNAAIRAVTRTAISRDIRVYGIKRGFNGLIHGELEELNLRSVSDIIQYGGTMLYTARCPEFQQEDGLRKAKKTCFDHDIQGIIVIGGDGSFKGAAEFSKRGVPCIGIPGTIDNDIGCTDYTIGYDTAMNTVTQMVDKLRDTTMAHDRCSVVEVMGRHAGYIALNAGIACGASYIIVPEFEFDFNDLLQKMRDASSKGKHHFIILVAEGHGNVMELAKQIQDHTGIESRATILGHVQRGGSPTVQDRVVASRMGHRAVELLLEGSSGRVVGMQDGDLVDYDIQQALEMKKVFPKDLYELALEISC